MTDAIRKQIAALRNEGWYATDHTEAGAIADTMQSLLDEKKGDGYTIEMLGNENERLTARIAELEGVANGLWNVANKHQTRIAELEEVVLQLTTGKLAGALRDLPEVMAMADRIAKLEKSKT
jgi:hypothetical protein